jgi:hypothetical protein
LNKIKKWRTIYARQYKYINPEIILHHACFLKESLTVGKATVQPFHSLKKS